MSKTIWTIISGKGTFTWLYYVVVNFAILVSTKCPICSVVNPPLGASITPASSNSLNVDWCQDIVLDANYVVLPKRLSDRLFVDL
jgi:hypothetical protein